MQAVCNFKTWKTTEELEECNFDTLVEEIDIGEN